MGDPVQNFHIRADHTTNMAVCVWPIIKKSSLKPLGQIN